MPWLGLGIWLSCQNAEHASMKTYVWILAHAHSSRVQQRILDSSTAEVGGVDL